MSWVPSCPTCLTCLRALRALETFVPLFFYVAYMPYFFDRALHASIFYLPYVPSFSLHALLVLIFFFTCLTGLHVLRALCIFIF